MGNTNIPQGGAAGARNSRDTLTGADQLTDEQKRQRSAHKDDGSVGPSPSRPKDAPARIPGQSREPEHDAAHTGATKRNRGGDADQLDESDPYNPRNTTGAGDPEAYEGHANTGHSPPDAT
jgi:hypothetical protein